MKLLMLSFYFTPDLCAGSFRTQALIDALEPWRSKGLEVDLITTRPNRYASLRAEAENFEDHGWLRVHRVELPSHKSGMADQALAYLHYVHGVRKLARFKRWDAVFATSSRLMTAALGAHISKRLDVPLYLDIRDLFTDTMADILANSPMQTLMPAFRIIEQRSFNRASRINVVSRGFVPHLQLMGLKAPINVFTNGIDDVFLETDFSKIRDRSHPPLVVYAGNMGASQELHKIVPQVAKNLSGRVRFRLIGDGGRKDALQAALKSSGLGNVELLPPVPRLSLLDHYREADMLFLHLNGLNAFDKVLPSKLFEYGATAKPILAGVSGHSVDFLRQYMPDVEVFNPLDVNAMTRAVERLIEAPPMSSRSQFLELFNRSRIMKSLANDIIEMMLDIFSAKEKRIDR